MNICVPSLREAPEELHEVTAYFQQQQALEDSMRVYEDALYRHIGVKNLLPQWYWMQDGDSIIDCVGLITNDFTSHDELWPWLRAPYIDPRYRGHGLAFRLTEHITQQVRQLDFMWLHLRTDLKGLYGKAGFYFDRPGYHPRREVSRVYSHNL